MRDRETGWRLRETQRGEECDRQERERENEWETDREKRDRMEIERERERQGGDKETGETETG